MVLFQYYIPYRYYQMQIIYRCKLYYCKLFSDQIKYNQNYKLNMGKVGCLAGLMETFMG